MDAEKLKNITAQLATDYLSFTGKAELGKSSLSVGDYLMFRNQAIQEATIGIVSHKIDRSYNSANMPDYPIETTNRAAHHDVIISEPATSHCKEEYISEDKDEKNAFPDSTASDQHNIIPLEQPEIDINPNTDNMLKIMQRFKDY